MSLARGLGLTRSCVCLAARWLMVLAGTAIVTGCGEKKPPEVIVYTALDQEYSEPILREFTRSTGIEVRTKYDAESTKTVGLTEEILAERGHPRCDLFWNNEILNTLRLEREGLLRVRVAAGRRISGQRKIPNRNVVRLRGTGRVLIVNTNQVAEERRPKSIRDLADPQWYERCGNAKPLFGTTATHAACLFAAWGEDKAKEFFQGVKRNARIMSGNRQVAQAVGSHALAFGLTDTDDALVEIEHGSPVAIVYPDQRDGEVGTLFIPNTLALIKGSSHPQQAEKLLDYLLSAEVEKKLAEGPSAQIPLCEGVAASPRVKTPSEVRAMEVDWSAAAAKWDTAAEFLKTEFATP